jgi:hydroxypyruvate isomerase
MDMDRRTFARNTATAAFGVAALRHRSFLDLGGAGRARESLPHNSPYRLSVMLWTVFRDLPFEERIGKIAEAGYANVELVGEYENWSADDFARANRTRKKLGITFDATAGLKYGLCNPSDRDLLLRDLRKALSAMETLSCPSIILLSGNAVPGMSREAQHRSCIDGLVAAARLIEGKTIAGKPVRLLLETIDPEENPRCFLTSAAEAFEVVKALDHPQVQFLYDFFHEQIAEGNLIEKLEKNIEHVGLIHVADVPGRHEPGTGEINYENIFHKLGELRYEGVVAMEFHPTGDPVATLRASREMAMRLGNGARLRRSRISRF